MPASVSSFGILITNRTVDRTKNPSGIQKYFTLVPLVAADCAHPVGYFTTSVIEPLFEGRLLLFDLSGEIATDATYSLTVRRTSSSRSALDFAGRATLIILRVMPF